jgi:glucose/arabinose dehydrogenase
MMQRCLPALLAVLLAAAIGTACGGDDDDGEDQLAFGLVAETVVSGGLADNVSAIAFAPDGRMFFAEQIKGTIRIVNADGTLQEEPFTQIQVADWLQQDWGLTGLAIDPDFSENHYVYAFYTKFLRTFDFTREDGSISEHDIGQPVIVRFTEANGVAEDTTVVTEDFPETDEEKPGYNVNGELHFGPDGFLYASMGDYDLFEKAPGVIQNPGSPIGKLLRLDKETGEAADDNPLVGEDLADPRVYAYGFREPFPFTWGPDDTLYGTDNTTVSCEELNIIEPGEYYGWPEMGSFPFDDCDVAPGVQPVHHFSREGLAPENFLSWVEVSGLAYLAGSPYTQLTDSLMVCESHKSGDDPSAGVLRRLVIENGAVTASEVIDDVCGGHVAIGPDGLIYYTTVNEIRRLVDSGEPVPPDQGAPSR